MKWMTQYENWMMTLMSLDVHFNSQKRKALLLMNKFVTHPLSMLIMVDHLVFNLVIEQYYFCFFYHLMLQV